VRDGVSRLRAVQFLAGTGQMNNELGMKLPRL
jgi:hypothetical protein